MECARVGRIPNYLRTTTNKYKGLITEKIAKDHLRKKGFDCLDFDHLIYKINEFQRANMEMNSYEEQEIKTLEDELMGDLKEFSSKSPPKTGSHVTQFQVSGKNWEEFRKEKLTTTQWRIENLPEELRKEIASLRYWEENFESIKSYRKWLRKHGHYRPDLIAKKEKEVFIVEVKSQKNGKTALFGEHQKKALLKACDFGLLPILLIVPIDVDIEIGEPKLKVGKEHFET